jgi:hypothetical protein
MKETIDALQTLVLLMTLLLSVIMLLGFVYVFRLLLAALKQLAQFASDRPVIAVQPAPQAPAAQVEKHAPAAEKPEDAPKALSSLPRYRCHRCDAKLPESPVSSRIDGTTTLLNYKCGRCGKQTEVNPEKDTPIT